MNRYFHTPVSNSSAWDSPRSSVPSSHTVWPSADSLVPWADSQDLSKHHPFLLPTSKPITPELDSFLESEEEQSPPPFTQAFPSYQSSYMPTLDHVLHTNHLHLYHDQTPDPDVGLVPTSDAAPFQYAASEYVKPSSSSSSSSSTLHPGVSQQTQYSSYPEYYPDYSVPPPQSPHSDPRPSSSGTFHSSASSQVCYSQLFYYNNPKEASSRHSLPLDNDLSAYNNYSQASSTVPVGLSGELISSPTPPYSISPTPSFELPSSLKRKVDDAVYDAMLPAAPDDGRPPTKRTRRKQGFSPSYSQPFTSGPSDEQHHPMLAPGHHDQAVYSTTVPNTYAHPPFTMPSVGSDVGSCPSTPAIPVTQSAPSSGRLSNVVFVHYPQPSDRACQPEEGLPFEHSPTELPPRQYPGGNYAASPLKPPKMTGKIPGSAMDYLPILEDRFLRLENAISRYVELRAERALRNSVLPGLPRPAGDDGHGCASTAI